MYFFKILFSSSYGSEAYWRSVEGDNLKKTSKLLDTVVLCTLVIQQSLYVLGSECSLYTKLIGANRAIANSNGPYNCDRNMTRKWYRFDGAAGTRMPETCPEPLRCGTHAPGWLHGKHPLPGDGVVQREVCFHWNNNCCRWKKQIRLRNCGGFYVYELETPPTCNLRYCGNGGEGMWVTAEIYPG